MARALQFSGLGTYAPRPTNAQGLLLNGPFRMGLFAFAPGATPEVPQAVPVVRPAVATFQMRPVVKPIPMPRLPWRPVVKGNAGPALSVMQNGGGLGGLGTAIEDQWVGHIGCSELKRVLFQIQTTVEFAEKTGQTNSVAYAQAKKILAAEQGLGTRTIFAFWSCEGSVKDANTILSDLTKSLSSGPGITTGNVTPDTSGEKMISVVKWVVAGVGVVGIVYLAGPLVRSISSALARRIA